MVRSLLSAVGKEVRGMHQAAYILAGFAFGSQILALVRDRLLASSFGTGPTLDVYYAAFRIPDFLFATVASLLSLYALLPVLSKFEAEDERYIVSFLRQALFIFFIAMAAIAGIAAYFAPELVTWIAPGIAHDPTQHANLVLLARILLLQPIFLGASNILAALTQLRHRFFLYSISPLLYNVGIIVGIIFFYPAYGVAGLGWGVVLGAFLHVLIQLPFFFAEKSEQHLPPRRVWQSLLRVLALSVPRTVALAAGQISLLILIAMASYFAPGSISVFMFAWNLQAVPLTIIGVSYSVAAFPTLARFHASGNMQEFVSHIETALRHMLFWSIPAIVLMIVLRAQIVRIVLGAGAFDWNATRLTAAALAFFMISLAAQSATLLITRAYYAAGRTTTPLLLGTLSVLISVGSAALLVMFFHSSPLVRYFLESLSRVADLPGTTVIMLALGFSIGAVAQAVLGLHLFVRDFGVSLQGLGRLAFQSFSASVIGGACAYFALTLMGFLVDIDTVPGIVAQGTIGGIVGVVGTTLVLYLLDNQELKEAISTIKRRFKDSPKVALEPTDVSS